MLCQRSRHSPPKVLLHPWDFPSGPWEQVHVDYAGPFINKTIIILVDAYSKWLKVIPVSAATSNVIEHLHMIFATHGLPKVLVTDNGSQFTSAKFKIFTQRNGVHHFFSAPYPPARNGLAERAVQSFKEHMKSMESGSLQEKLARFLL